MDQRKFSLIIFIVALLGACTSGDDRNNSGEHKIRAAPDSLSALQEEPNKKGTSQEIDTLDFEIAFNRFFAALQTADTAVLNQFIHSELGVWIIEQPGAVPKMTRVTDLRLFKREYQNRSFFTVSQEVKACDLVEEPFPDFDCAAMDEGHTGYTKDGCFAWNPDKFLTSGYWNYASLTETQIDQVKATLPLVQKSVLHTRTSFEFHFGYVNRQWRLLFSKLIYPCSA